MYISLLCEWKIPHVLTSMLPLIFPHSSVIPCSFPQLFDMGLCVKQ